MLAPMVRLTFRQRIQRIGFAFGCAGVLLAISLFPHAAAAAALDDVKIEVSREACKGFGANDKSFTVYATNLSPRQSIDATFKYNSVPAQQHFILFDADLNPVTDRFPKMHTRRLAPRETVPIGCTYTFRAAPQPPGPLMVPIVITKQSASYWQPDTPELPEENARSYAMFYLQGGVGECPQGAKPPGLFYFVNLHPFAQLSAPDLPPFSTMRAGCSNGSSKPSPIANATLEVMAGVLASEPLAASAPAPAAPALSPAPEAKGATSGQHPEPKIAEAAASPPAASPPAASPPSASPPAASPPVALPPAASPQASSPPAPSPPPSLPLGTVLQIQNVCAGSAPPGWIKINDAWNPTVCGNPSKITYNVWTIQQFADQPPGALIQACKGSVPAGWAVVGTGWNPTMCGNPAINQANVMTLRRLN
jgi:hypothetical protein